MKTLIRLLLCDTEINQSICPDLFVGKLLMITVACSTCFVYADLSDISSPEPQAHQVSVYYTHTLASILCPYTFLAHHGELIVYAGIGLPSVVCQHFQMTSPLKPRCRFLSYFTNSIYRLGERIIVFFLPIGLELWLLYAKRPLFSCCATYFNGYYLIICFITNRIVRIVRILK